MTFSFLDNDHHRAQNRVHEASSLTTSLPPPVPPKSPINSSFSLRKIHASSSRSTTRRRSRSHSSSVARSTVQAQTERDSDTDIDIVGSSFPLPPTPPTKYASASCISKLIDPYSHSSFNLLKSSLQQEHHDQINPEDQALAWSREVGAARSKSLKQLIMPNRLLKRTKKFEAEKAPLLKPEASHVSFKSVNGVARDDNRHETTPAQLLPSPVIKQVLSTSNTIFPTVSTQRPTPETLGRFLTPRDADFDIEKNARRSAHRRSRSFSELITSSSSSSPFLDQLSMRAAVEQPWRSSETWLALHTERSRRAKEQNHQSSMTSSSIGLGQGGRRGVGSGGTFFGADMNVPLPGNSRVRTDTRLRTINLVNTSKTGGGRQYYAQNEDRDSPGYGGSIPISPSAVTQETLLTPTSPSRTRTPFTTTSPMYQHKAQAALNVTTSHKYRFNREDHLSDDDHPSPPARWYTPIGEETSDRIMPALVSSTINQDTVALVMANDEDDHSDLLPPLLPRTVTRSSSFSSTSRNTTPIPWAQRSGTATPTHTSPRTPSRQAQTQSRSRLDVSAGLTHASKNQSSPLSIRSYSSDGYGTPKTWTREDPSPPRKSVTDIVMDPRIRHERVLGTLPSADPHAKWFAYPGRPQRKASESPAELGSEADTKRSDDRGQYRKGYSLRRSTSPHRARRAKKLFEHEHREHQSRPSDESEQHRRTAAEKANHGKTRDMVVNGSRHEDDGLSRSGSRSGIRTKGFWKAPFNWSTEKRKEHLRNPNGAQ
ncbi:hypothetical protein IAU59_006457 [Kwoniella sp. CBS 9459]